MNKQLLIGQLRAGRTGTEILNILDMVVGEVEDTNIQDCAEHYAAISAPTLQTIEF